MKRCVIKNVFFLPGNLCSVEMGLEQRHRVSDKRCVLGEWVVRAAGDVSWSRALRRKVTGSDWPAQFSKDAFIHSLTRLRAHELFMLRILFYWVGNQCILFGGRGNSEALPPDNTGTQWLAEWSSKGTLKTSYSGQQRDYSARPPSGSSFQQMGRSWRHANTSM